MAPLQFIIVPCTAFSARSRHCNQTSATTVSARDRVHYSQRNTQHNTPILDGFSPKPRGGGHRQRTRCPWDDHVTILTRATTEVSLFPSKKVFCLTGGSLTPNRQHLIHSYLSRIFFVLYAGHGHWLVIGYAALSLFFSEISFWVRRMELPPVRESLRNEMVHLSRRMWLLSIDTPPYTGINWCFALSRRLVVPKNSF